MSRASIRSPASSSRTRRRTSSADRSAARSCRTSGSSSATIRARARIRAARSCSRCRRRWRARAISASTARRSTTRPPGRPSRTRPFRRSRQSPQALKLLDLIPLPNAPGTENGTRDNFTASGVEKFTQNSYNTRIDGRLSDKMNTFGRYSLGKFSRDGQGALGIAGGPQFVGHRRRLGVAQSEPGLWHRHDRVAVAAGRLPLRLVPGTRSTCCRPTSARRRRPTPAFPNLNNDATFTSGLPSLFMRGNQPDMNWGYGLGVNGCNCPLAENEKQWQMVGNITKIWGNHTSKAGIDVRRAYNLRVPSDQHRSGELYVQRAAHEQRRRRRPRPRHASCSVTSRTAPAWRSPATSAAAPTRASGSGGTSTTRRTRGAPTRS